MASYSNQFNIRIAEIARIEFGDVLTDGGFPVIVSTVVMQLPVLEMLAKVLANTIAEYKDKMSKTPNTNQTNKSLS